MNQSNPVVKDTNFLRLIGSCTGSKYVFKIHINRCNVLKLPPRATLTRSFFNSTKLPHPEV